MDCLDKTLINQRKSSIDDCISDTDDTEDDSGIAEISECSLTYDLTSDCEIIDENLSNVINLNENTMLSSFFAFW